MLAPVSLPRTTAVRRTVGRFLTSRHIDIVALSVYRLATMHVILLLWHVFEEHTMSDAGAQLPQYGRNVGIGLARIAPHPQLVVVIQPMTPLMVQSGSDLP